jgi:hypothetical protein
MAQDQAPMTDEELEEFEAAMEEQGEELREVVCDEE